MHYHFIGIKGSGMASLASIMFDCGNQVTGSDIEKYIFTQERLEKRNIKITPFDKDNIKENSIVIIGLAFDETNPEVQQAMAMPSVTTYYYNDFLGKLLEDYVSISVAGTHGKTTTTGMIAHVMDAVAPTGFLIGDGHGEMPEHSRYFVLESCEYKRHFLAYRPQYAIITNIELDHVDYYKDMEDYKNAFETFANQVQKGIVLFGDDEAVKELNIKTHHLYYGTHDRNDVQAKNIEEDENGMRFDIYYHDVFFGRFDLPFVGKPLLWNSIGVIALGIMEGIGADVLQESLATFSGVDRRFTIEVNKENVYIDDYAHHPTAIRFMIEAARTKYPNKKVIAIFKPDRYSRIYYFMKDFAQALETADQVYLCHFPENAAKEEGIDITIQDLADITKNAIVVSEDEVGAKQLAQQGPAVYLFMSSKDIYKFKNIVREFQ